MLTHRCKRLLARNILKAALKNANFRAKLIHSCDCFLVASILEMFKHTNYIAADIHATKLIHKQSDHMCI
jgi:hypothetical protein